MVAIGSNAMNTVVTVFSILAGFLIARMTLTVDPTLQQAKTWHELQLMKQTVRNKLFRQKLLFFFYLLTLGLTLAMHLTPLAMAELLGWLQTVFLGCATFVFLASFSLPGSLMKTQMERYEAALEDAQPKVITEAKKAPPSRVRPAS
ncbi:MAG: hypothetical protein GDA52_10495 [Rhodobacteraceae bacterium]|nr:hypothetical protein [Paracoccaceae bacterium]